MTGAYQQQVAQAMQTNDQRTVEKLDEYRDALERGVFVVLFGQFEREVGEHFEQAVSTRLAEANWLKRRGWDVPSYSSQKVPFETKLALVLDRQLGEHQRAMTAYARRNHCAHGGTTEPVGSIDQFVQDLYAWQARLQK